MLTFTTDHVFHIGNQHLHTGLPAQDYALSGTLPDAAYAVVSDGCSSGDKTDIGSRLLSLATVQSIAKYWARLRRVSIQKFVDIHQEVLLSTAQNLLGLSLNDLLATSLYALISKNAGGILHLRGDGVMATLDRDGKLTILRIEWENNTPFYPAYTGLNFQTFVQHHGGDENAPNVRWTKCVRSGSLETTTHGSQSLKEGVQGFTWELTSSEVQSLCYVAVFTDGVTQVEGLQWQEVVGELLHFKSTAGNFAKRRMNRFLRDAQSMGRGPQDDIGYAVIQINETQEKEGESDANPQG